MNEKVKKVAETIWNAFRRTVSVSDIFTDIRLLYLSSQSANLLGVTVVLAISIICPYIISYSCGIKLFFIRHSSNLISLQYKALHKILVYLSISPVGVLYFIFLDLLDVLFVYYKTIQIVIFNKDEYEIKYLQETMAKQLAMTRMDYEGIKRQRAVAQLSFVFARFFFFLIFCCFCQNLRNFLRILFENRQNVISVKKNVLNFSGQFFPFLRLVYIVFALFVHLFLQCMNQYHKQLFN